MDVMAACSGFVYAYSVADAYIRSGQFKNALVIGAETLSRFLDFSDRGTCILFGDGAGAVVLSASDEEGGGLQGLEMTTDPDGAYMIWLPSGGSRSPVSGGTIARGEHYVRMEGSETYRYATKTMATTALKAIERAGWQPDEIDLFIPHQANVRIIESVAKGLGLPMDKMFVNLDRYGNTSAASVGIALAEAVDSGRIKIGDKIVLVAFGAGLTSGGIAMEWTADPTCGQRAASVEPARERARAGRLVVGRLDPRPAARDPQGQARPCRSTTWSPASPSRPIPNPRCGRDRKRRPNTDLWSRFGPCRAQPAKLSSQASGQLRAKQLLPDVPSGSNCRL